MNLFVTLLILYNATYIAKALKEIKYEGSLALEVIYPPFQMWESFIKLSYESLEYLKGL